MLKVLLWISCVDIGHDWLSWQKVQFGKSNYLVDEQFIIVDAPDLVDLANDLATYFVDFAGPLCALRWKHMECMACSSKGTPEKSIKFLFWRIRCNLWACHGNTLRVRWASNQSLDLAMLLHAEWNVDHIW